jgi:hypothetical protein
VPTLTEPFTYLLQTFKVFPLTIDMPVGGVGAGGGGGGGKGFWSISSAGVAGPVG